MRKFLLLAFGLGIALAIERRANTLGISPRTVMLGAVQNWLNRLNGRQAAPARSSDA